MRPSSVPALLDAKTAKIFEDIHDSPREADLGLSIYSRLFDFARKLENYGPAPLFQYILTITTEPPLEFRQDPWLRLTVHGGPAAERLLGVDL